MTRTVERNDDAVAQGRARRLGKPRHQLRTGKVSLLSPFIAAKVPTEIHVQRKRPDLLRLSTN